MTRCVAAALVLISLGLVGLAGCGGESVSESTTTSVAATTAPATPAPPTASLPATAPTAPLGGENLPPQTAVPGVRVGDARTLATAKELVDVLYQSGDPARPAARARLEDGGYADGVVRDQAGTDPTTGLALLRSYALRLRDEAAARDEVSAAVDEVRSSSSAASSDIDVSGIPGAQALRVEVDQGGLRGTVVFVTFPAGPAVYGIQGVSANGADIPEDEIIGAARALATRVGATP
jgi:hypothetical protein